MSAKTDLRLVAVFVVAFSLAALGGPLASDFHLPSVQFAHALNQPCVVTGSSGGCSEAWYPSGPEMSTELVTVFSDPTAEYTNLIGPNPSIDFTDSPVPGALGIGPTSPFPGPGYYLTASVPELGYYEIQFMQANTFWNCGFNYGNSACGIQARQGIAHMMDKSIFVADPNILPAHGIPIDNPVPTSSGGNLLSANSCLWDSTFSETNTAGASCTVGGGNGQSHGGASYHLASASGADGFAWLQAPGSMDLNAAAQHFVNAGLATGFNSATSVLTGLAPGLTTCGQAGSGCTVPTFFVRFDDLVRLDLGNSLAAQICYLFTGAYTTPCPPFLNVVRGSITQFTGYQTSPTSVNDSWWFYTASYSSVSFYDDSLYYTYNSRFVSGVPTNQCTTGSGSTCSPGPCSKGSVPTAAASNYMYICDPTYDIDSTTLERQTIGVNVVSPCLAAPGDPVAGAISNQPTTPGNGKCSNSTTSSHSEGIQVEDYFGQKVFTLPVYELNDQFGYLQCDRNQMVSGSCPTNVSWSRAINDAGIGLPNYFTWLSAYNPRPTTTYTCGPTTCTVPANTIRQGFSQTTHSVNPYLASSSQDVYIVNSVYDSLFKKNPLATSQYLDWMTVSASLQSAVSYNGGLTGPPTTACTDTNGCTYDFILRPDLQWQDGSAVTSYDVAFSYLSMVGSGAYLGTGASNMAGITILNPRQFDISVTGNGPSELNTLTSIPILPGHYWSNAGSSTWDSTVASCLGRNTCPDAQYTLSGPTVACSGTCTVPAANMQINVANTMPSFDPIASHIMVGSGPWQCGTVTTTTGSGQCTPTGMGRGQNSYTLTAYAAFHRSSTRAAQYIWSEESDQLGAALGAASAVGSCFNLPVNLAGPCGHWQQGIGNPGSGSIVSVSTVSSVDIFYLLNWVAPFQSTGVQADFTFTPGSPTTGDTVTFSQSTPSSLSILTYNWDFGDGTSTTGSGPVTHTYAAGTYNAVLSISDSLGVVYYRVQHSVSVTTGLAHSLSGDFVYSPSMPAVGTTVIFSAAAAGGTPSYTYMWSFGDGTTGTGPTVPHQYLTSGVFSVSLTIKDSATPTPNTAPDAHSITVSSNPPPTGVITFQPVFYALTPFDGSTTLTPNPGGSSCQTPNTYYDC